MSKTKKIGIDELLDQKFDLDSVRDLSFEDGLVLADAVVKQVEQGELTLDQSILAYERGSKLLQHLRSLLDGAEKKLEILNDNKKR